MKIVDIFETLDNTPGKNDKIKILQENESDLLKKILVYTYNELKQYYVTTHTIPESRKVSILEEISIDENKLWNSFLDILDKCDRHEISGNSAIHEIKSYFGKMPDEYEKWMRRVLDRHLNVGITAKSINKAYKKSKKEPDLIYSFEVQLAENWNKFEEKIVKENKPVAIEPKLDGFRCLAIYKNGKCSLFSRNGKEISKNFQNTVCFEIENLFKDRKGYNFVLDGELMGNSFKETSQQVHKKTNADVENIKFHVFDYLSYEDWTNQYSSLTCMEARNVIEDMAFDVHCNYVKSVPRIIDYPTQVRQYHDQFFNEGYEGAMVKTLFTKYKFGRGNNVLKYKLFEDIDLKCIAFEEGSGKFSGTLGAIIVNFNGVLVNVGSGFSDEQRKEIWENQSKFRFKTVEIRYFEVTPDGSLRFPTFRCWRPDKD